MTTLYRPTISLVTPVYDPAPAQLAAAIASVRAQSYSRWQLLLVDDGSTRPGVREVLDRAAAADPRIRTHHRVANGGIVAASNDALAMATGDYVGFLDHDDMLDPAALAAVVGLLQREPATDVVYTDEDKIGDDGSLLDHLAKPGWSPDLLLGCMYFGHLTVYRTDLVLAVGGLRPGYDGSQDWDLALRVTARTSRVGHVPAALYHWRAAEASTARGVEAKPYTVDAGRRAVADRLAADGVDAAVADSVIPGWFHVRRRVAGQPLVSVILPTAGTARPVHGRTVQLVRNALHGLAVRTDYRALEVICLVSANAPPGLEDELRSSAEAPDQVVRTAGAFNFAATVNAGAARARGEFLLLLNDDVEPLRPDWLSIMLGHAQSLGVGVVGAKLLYEDGRIQHAGVIHNASLPMHQRRTLPDRPGPCGSLLLTSNLMAVTGACLLTPARVFAEVGGMSPAFPLNFNDIDYCLKVHSRGYRVLLDPQAALYHYESATRDPTVHQEEVDRFLARWREVAADDPFARPEIVAMGVPRRPVPLAAG